MAIVVNRKKARQRFMEWLRHFNKRITNPLTLTFAGHRVYAVVHHLGRRSGRAYKTPVLAAPVEGGFIIPLPYGDQVDWYRNVAAAGSCTILWQGKRYEVTEPTIIDAEEGLLAYTGLTQKLLRRNEVEHFLKLKNT